MTPLAILDRSPPAPTTDPIMFQIFLEIWVYVLGFAAVVSAAFLVVALIVSMRKAQKRAKRMRGEE